MSKDTFLQAELSKVNVEDREALRSFLTEKKCYKADVFEYEPYKTLIVDPISFYDNAALNISDFPSEGADCYEIGIDSYRLQEQLFVLKEDRAVYYWSYSGKKIRVASSFLEFWDTLVKKSPTFAKNWSNTLKEASSTLTEEQVEKLREIFGTQDIDKIIEIYNALNFYYQLKL